MKALVASRLLLGDFDDWKTFEQERETAGKILNRRAARSVSSQIGRNYRELSAEMRQFIDKNFARCNYDDLARLCDAVRPGIGLYLRLDDFEASLFALAEPVKRRFPFYAHVSISIYGLQFEFPEHHFINDMDAAFEDLKETRQRIDALGLTDANVKRQRDAIVPLISREKFISRSMVSASFSLVEAFLSGLFFTALSTNFLGILHCDDGLLSYAKSKESAALKDRINRIVKFASSGKMDGGTDPFRSFIEIGKRYRDAIHHTTPFGRKDIEAGERLLALYEVKSDVAIQCALLSLNTVLVISGWIYDQEDRNIVPDDCNTLRNKIMEYSLQHGLIKTGQLRGPDSQ